MITARLRARSAVRAVATAALLVMSLGAVSAPPSAAAPAKADGDLLAQVAEKVAAFNPASSDEVLVIETHGKRVAGLWKPKAGSPETAVAPSAVSPSAVGGTGQAFISWVRSGDVLWYHGNATGWPRGTIVVGVQSLSPNGHWGQYYVTKCKQSTSCSSPSYSYYCPLAGVWWSYVDAYSDTNTSLPMDTDKRSAVVYY